jgi:hypothetical protein
LIQPIEKNIIRTFVGISLFLTLARAELNALGSIPASKDVGLISGANYSGGGQSNFQ